MCRDTFGCQQLFWVSPLFLKLSICLDRILSWLVLQWILRSFLTVFCRGFFFSLFMLLLRILFLSSYASWVSSSVQGFNFHLWLCGYPSVCRLQVFGLQSCLSPPHWYRYFQFSRSEIRPAQSCLCPFVQTCLSHVCCLLAFAPLQQWAPFDSAAAVAQARTHVSPGLLPLCPSTLQPHVPHCYQGELSRTELWGFSAITDKVWGELGMCNLLDHPFGSN